jgi:hypothetical protein
MSQTIAAAPRASAPPSATRAANADRRFYLIAAIVMLLSTAGGFRNFYLHGRNFMNLPIHPRILPFIVAHGLAMTGWVLVFLLQSALIQSGRRKLHLVIGPLACLFAALTVILGLIAASYSAHFNPIASAELGGARPFLATMYAEMLLFGTFVALGYFYRRKPAIHRPMMLLATVVIQSGALGRLPYIGDLAVRPLYAWTLDLLLGALLFFLQWAMSRKPNRPFLIGYAALALVAVVSVAIGHTSTWDRLASLVSP